MPNERPAEKAFDLARTQFATTKELRTKHRNRPFLLQIVDDTMIITPGSRAASRAPIQLPKDVFVAVYDRLKDRPHLSVRGLDDITHNGSYVIALVEAVQSPSMSALD